MRLMHFITLLLFAFILCLKAVGQTKRNNSYDPYFIETKDTVSPYGPSHITRDILQDKNGNFWFATWQGIIKYDGKLFTNYTLKKNLIHFHVFCCYEDKKGNLWFGTARGGLYRYDGKLFKLFTTRDGLVDDNVSCIMEDRAGNIWFGTEHGASRYDGKTFTSFTAQNGLSNSYINSILEDKTGKLWFGSNDGLYIFDGRSFISFADKSGVPFKNVASLFHDKAGKIWIGRLDGLTVYDGKSGKDGFTDLLSNFLTYYINGDAAGNVWLTQGANNIYFPDVPKQVLYRYDGKTFTSIAEKYEPNDFQIFGNMTDREGNVWFGTMHGPCRYDGKSFTYFTKSGMADPYRK